MFETIGTQFIPDSVTKETGATLEFSFGNHDHKPERNLLRVLEDEKYVRHDLIVFLHWRVNIYKFLQPFSACGINIVT